MPDHVLITGGAGFVGAHLADRLLRGGQPVLLFDNLSRAFVERNVELLRGRHGARVELWVSDVRDEVAVGDAVRRASFVFHLAAQAAVTRSVSDPALDFEVNARGTFNVLEALRRLDRPPPLLFASTSKVYGALPDVALEADGERYQPRCERTREHGISEEQPLDLRSPHGCSRGAADQYVLDYARTFGLDAAVLRMSCVYGPRQYGNEDQGWIAHFVARALRGDPITLYGDGLQVRDALFIDDLVDALLLARREIRRASGRAFNLGGGPARAVSLLELLDLITELSGRRPAVSLAPWRPGDPRYYVSDCRAFHALTGWAPRVGLRDGLRALHAWRLGVEERLGAVYAGDALAPPLEVAS
ncbi:CDP-paratose 2-epimerase [Sorangium cellulosum]|uniref:CDP-paratose 2-epimerase n=1 Tax=Sorangium cellulosum TaxID=56 RepID=A0A4P2QCR0_SORCE|nr:NAD-dependent epimerase/dehydratase family protein [Sorangium cellulosum]AUX27525.1 CDP-paratose 2-epimerase [Sorangium cellulosum]